MDNYSQLAADFANALKRGNYTQAGVFIAPSKKEAWSSQRLKSEYEGMIEYGEGPATFVEVMETFDDWPTKEQGDVGWAYVAIAGDEFSEAVAVVVCNEGDQFRIRDIEWGRP